MYFYQSDDVQKNVDTEGNDRRLLRFDRLLEPRRGKAASTEVVRGRRACWVLSTHDLTIISFSLGPVSGPYTSSDHSVESALSSHHRLPGPPRRTCTPGPFEQCRPYLDFLFVILPMHEYE